MKCISIHQPWADLIISGKRTLEIRKWATSYRGKLLIHAALKVEKKECRRFSIILSTVGAIIGFVELVDVRKLSVKEWRDSVLSHLEVGPRCYGKRTFAWVLRKPHKFSTSIPFKGILGLFNVPDALIPIRKLGVIKSPAQMATLIFIKDLTCF